MILVKFGCWSGLVGQFFKVGWGLYARHEIVDEFGRVCIPGMAV